MLNPSQQALLDQLLTTLTRDQSVWLSGYLAGRAGAGAASADIQAGAPDKPAVDIYYATETGNSKALSLQLMKAVKAAGYKVKNAAVNRLKLADISTDHVAIFLCSTHGEGDPPESAATFFEAVRTAPDGALAGLAYATLGLGDKSYDIFCGAATELDTQLRRLGGTPFQEIALFDVDYATHTPAWIEASVAALEARYATASVRAGGITTVDDTPTLRTGKGYSRLEPVDATVTDIINLNDIGSAKATYHIEVTPSEALYYTPGDALGIVLPVTGAEKEPTPRLYSIASSPSAHGEVIHLTVALAKHTNPDGSTGYGLASRYLADLKPGDTVRCYIVQNQLFNLPADDQDAIMIGPGTGIAPFRSFVYERSERGASGRNWVLYGDQHAHCDFLYQAEWQEHLATDAIARMDLAFSRDQEDKVYVQHKLQEQSGRLMEWLESGAAIYVCGAKDPMSRDVERTLTEIIAAHRGISLDAAADALGELAEAGRYVKDVY